MCLWFGIGFACACSGVPQKISSLALRGSANICQRSSQTWHSPVVTFGRCSARVRIDRTQIPNALKVRHACVNSVLAGMIGQSISVLSTCQCDDVHVRTVNVSAIICATEQATTSQPLQSKPGAEARGIYSSTCGPSWLTNELLGSAVIYYSHLRVKVDCSFGDQFRS